ncbi:MAG TPA: erythromycin esterase family protein [Chryseolinea sp.]|nr:erythromycin esterase family protein [Chryseolinea sp.]
MKKLSALLLIVSLTSWNFACKEDDDEHVDPVTASLVETLNEELVHVTTDPGQWIDNQLHFLDAVAAHDIVGLGEATHGTAEFFKAKHRILEYLVENHGFKIFAIEADFGESIFINEAVLKSDKSQIENLMKTKMHFWTWKTTEVRDMLYWMCDYNLGKTEAQKVQYWGVDCQFNTYNPDMVSDNLGTANVPFKSFADEILNEARSASGDRFASYTQGTFDTYLEKVDALKDSVTKYEADITDAGLTLQLVEVIKQVSEVVYYSGKSNVQKNYRDEYMAKNTGWLHSYFNDAKIVLWAHNYHVSDYFLSNYPSASSMGHQLKADFPNDYTTIGFLFSNGSFTAVTQSGEQFQGINTQTLDEDPKLGSINDVMSRAEAAAFTVSLSDLQNHDEWTKAFNGGIEYFHIGSVYNKKPSDYYSEFDVNFFDRLIYFDRTTASVQLK